MLLISQAIEDLTKALEFESNSADILHERGMLSVTENLFLCVIWTTD